MQLALIVVFGYVTVLGHTENIVTKWDPSTAAGEHGYHRHDELGEEAVRGVPRGIPDQFDPLDIPDQHFFLDLEEITVTANTSSVVVRGLSGLKVNALSLGELGDGKVTVNISLPSLSVDGQYEMQGSITQSELRLPLDGDGPFTGGFNDLELHTSIRLGIDDKGQILLQDFDLVWNMSDIRVRVEGLFGDQALGKIINKILADTLAHLVLKVYHDKITDYVITFVKGEGAACLLSLHKDHGKAPQLAQGGFDACGFDSAQTPLALSVARSLLGSVRTQTAQTAQQRAAVELVAAAQDAEGPETDSDGTGLQTADEPSVLPHGAFTEDEDEDVVFAEDTIEQLLGLLGLMAQSPSAENAAEGQWDRKGQPAGNFRVVFTGQTRLYPAGTLSHDDG